MSDLINRQAAIDAIKALWNDAPSAQHVSAMFDCEDAIRALPPAQSKSGQWVKHDIYYDCSRCSCIAPCTETADSFIWKLSNFCPDCGAKMQNTGRRIMIKDVLDAKNSSAQPEQRWMPCSERLPDPYEYCLWTTIDGRVVYHHCDGLFSKYIAWMPLPEPFTERREE